MKVTVYETVSESFELDAPDDLAPDELADWIESERTNGDHPRRFDAVLDTFWERAD
nr:hypothetical protein [[Pseudomonas] sp. BICA1-14]